VKPWWHEGIAREAPHQDVVAIYLDRSRILVAISSSYAISGVVLKITGVQSG
jgi:hypothetical protein